MRWNKTFNALLLNKIYDCAASIYVVPRRSGGREALAPDLFESNIGGYNKVCIMHRHKVNLRGGHLLYIIVVYKIHRRQTLHQNLLCTTE